MRQISGQRRRLAALAGCLTSMSGMGPLLLPRHSWMRGAWLGFMAMLLVWVIVSMVRLRRDEGCVRSGEPGS